MEVYTVFGQVMKRKQTLSNRIAAELRSEFAAGRWRAGDTLPSVDELRRRFGAGEYAVRTALKNLRDEGLLSISQGVGVTATGKDAWRWRGRVVFVAVGVPGSYYSQMLAHQVSMRLADEGWDLIFISLPSCPSIPFDLTILRRYIDTGIGCAVCYCSENEVIDLFVRAGVPCIVFGGGVRGAHNAANVVFGRSDGNFSQASSVICVDRRECFVELVAAMKERGVKRLLEVDYDRRIDRSFKAQLLDAGIVVQRLFGKWEKPGRWRVGEMREASHRMVSNFLANAWNRAHLPDAVLFDDDYFASGGIPALLEAGLRIPDNIRVVAWSNTGNELSFGFSLARLENDPFEHGRVLADYLLEILSGRKGRPPRLFTKFIPGESL